jgi:hypothetical protein
MCEEAQNAEDIIYKSVFPAIVRTLIRQGKLDADKLQDEEYFKSTLAQYLIDNEVEKLQVIIRLDSEFLKAAREAFEIGRETVGIVLLGTTIEQTLNTFYRYVLEEKELFSDEEITEVIRGSNINPKIGWLLALVSGYELDDELHKRICSLMELRNQIVHFKAAPSAGFDCELTGSYNLIKQKIENLGISNLLALPSDLSKSLDEILEYVYEQNDPNYKVVQEFFQQHQSAREVTQTEREVYEEG